MRRPDVRMILLLAAAMSLLAIAAQAQIAVPGGYTVSLHATTSDKVTSIAVDTGSGTLYVANANEAASLRRIDPDGTVTLVSPDFTTAGEFFPYDTTDLQYDHGYVYTLLANPDPLTPQPDLVRVNVSTGATQILSTSLPFGGGSLEAGLATRGSTLYVTPGDNGTGPIARWNLASQSLDPVLPGTFDGLGSLEYNPVDHMLYGTDGAAEVIRAIDPATGATTDVTTLPSAHRYNLAIDPSGTRLYWAEYDGDTVYQYDLTTSMTTPFVTGLGSGREFYHDMVFGPSSSGSGWSMYLGNDTDVLEVSGFPAPAGSIPTTSNVGLALMALAIAMVGGLALARRG